MTTSRDEQFISRLLRYQDDVYAYVLSLLPQRADAEDVAQQTALILWRKREQYDASRDFLPWAFGVARFEVRRRLRQRQSKQVGFSLDMIEELAAAPEHIEVEMGDQRLALESCLGELKKEQRQLVERCYQGDESIKSIAVTLATSPAALYMRLQRLRKVIFDCVSHKLAAGGVP
jgi:RNA polymerase sigma-70 factor, ECF subfamily